MLDSLVNSLHKNSFWINDECFDKRVITSLHQKALELHQNSQTHEASIGRLADQKVVKQIRGDWISWVDDWEATPELKTFSLFINQIKNKISRELFLSLKSYEGHFAVYPRGTGYNKHVDQHINSKHRQISTILYLSPWTEGLGGELKIYPPDLEAQIIQPLQGRFVCFLSADLPHEVLTTQQTRCSLTGWLRDDLPLM